MNPLDLNQNKYFLKCAFYFKDLYGKNFQLTPWQQEIFKAIYDPRITRVAIKATTQYGKACSNYTSILTSKGWKKHGDLVAGDYVFNDKGKQAQVLQVHPKTLCDVQITFSNGEVLQVHENHEWLVKNKNSKVFKIKETKEFFTKSLMQGIQRVYGLPISKPIQFCRKDLDIDPYTFGLWLGDGVSKSSIITDPIEYKDIIENLPYEISSFQIHKITGVYSWYFSGLLFRLRQLGVLGNKHIPDIYLQASIKQRLELLAGLIDSDGYVFNKDRKNGNRDRRVVISNTNKNLVDGIVDLIRGLGIRVNVVKVKACTSSSGIKGKKDVYQIGFNPTLFIPTRLKRKKVEITKVKSIYIDKVERIAPIEGNCITVEGGMYLVGKMLIPTHNSEVASMALDLIASERKEKILIIAPSGAQASIIMDKVIDHIFDHPFITGMVDYKGEALEKLKEEKSKTHISFKNGSEIFMLTADVRNIQREAKNLMGFGATIVIVDESSLIPDTMYSKILRMVGGVTNGKIIQLGNPFENNHFGKCFAGEKKHGIFQTKRYLCISIDFKIALREKRLTQEFLDEAREDMTELDWLIFYEVTFPEGGAEDALIPRNWIEFAINQKGCEGDYKQAGLDIARFGRDKTVYALRKGGILFPLEQTEKMDTMEVSGWTRSKLEKDKPGRLCVDVVGLGAGVYDRLEEIQGEGFEEEETSWEECELVPVNVGESPIDTDSKKKFANLRAQAWWHFRKLMKPDEKTGRSQISLPNDPELKKQLGEIRYKYSSEKKIKLEPKDEMKKRLGYSPDKADAVVLAFWDETEVEPQLIVASMN